MVDVRFLLNFLNRASVGKKLFMLLFIAIFPIIDIWLLIFLGATLSDYYNLLLAGILSFGLLGFFISLFTILNELKEIKNMIKNGTYPEKQFYKLAGSFVMALFMVIPGILSTTFGIFMLIPALRTAIGKKITTSFDKDIKEVYEYIKLYEIEI